MIEGNTDRAPFITDREQLPEEQRQNYDLIAQSRGSVGGPFGVLLNSPEVAGRVGHLGTYLRFESKLSGTERELAILTTACEFSCAYEWAAHEPLARQEGVREKAIEVVVRQDDSKCLTEVEALIIRYVRELVRESTVSDTLFQTAQDHFGIQALTELTTTIGYYSMLACVLNAFKLIPETDTFKLP